MNEKNFTIKFNIPSLKIEYLSANWEKEISRNDNFKLYEGHYEGIGPCSILMIRNIEKYMDEFVKMVNFINIYAQLNFMQLAKIFGFIKDKDKFCMIFERLRYSVQDCLNKKSLTEIEKYTILLQIMELLITFHDSKLRVFDLRPSNIYINYMGDVRLIYPFENIHLFKHGAEEDDEEILDRLIQDNEDLILRFTPPELLQDNEITGPFNDIWMLGCLWIELFSKKNVWEGYTENEITKQLKSYTMPKIPSDSSQLCWGIICECLNPFFKSRIDIKEVVMKFYTVLGKLEMNEVLLRMQTSSQLAGRVPIVNLNKSNTYTSRNESVKNDDPYSVRLCIEHPKYMTDLYCAKCNDVICTKCQFSSHKEHEESQLVVEIQNYVKEAGAQFGSFKTNFENFVQLAANNFPIDDKAFEYISKEKNMIDMIYEEHRTYITNQFDLFHKKINDLQDLELANLDKFKQFFQGKLDDLENKINSIADYNSKIMERLNEKIENIDNFLNLNTSEKEGTIKSIELFKGKLKKKKQKFVNLIQNYIEDSQESEKFKRYFQRAVMNLKENKTYELIRILDKLHQQLDSKYKSIDFQDYLNNIILELDEYALINSRNNAPKNVKEILISFFNSKKVISYNVTNNAMTINEADFSHTNYDLFLHFSRNININGSLFINGGWREENKVAMKTHLSYDTKSLKVFEEAEMLFGHCAHSLLFVPPQYIYCVSGVGTAKCEKYDLYSKTWVEIPELNLHRQNASLFYFNEQFLFAFGGLNWDDQLREFSYIEAVEKLDVGYFGNVNQIDKWEKVSTFKASNNVVIAKTVMTVIPLSSTKIILLGGMNKDQSYSDDVILFDFETMTFSEENYRIAKPTCFPNKYFLFFGELAYQFDNQGDVHEFDVKNLSFRVVSQQRPLAI